MISISLLAHIGINAQRRITPRMKMVRMLGPVTSMDGSADSFKLAPYHSVSLQLIDVLSYDARSCGRGAQIRDKIKVAVRSRLIIFIDDYFMYVACMFQSHGPSSRYLYSIHVRATFGE